jgi:DNA-binding winged helix-turn-helix (wHTH) protein
MYQACEAPLGKSCLEILAALLECGGGLVSKQGSIPRIWPNVVVEPGNLKVHMSALHDGGDGHLFAAT